jgi:DNA polymerase I-like protein with 3'-5' exonuclease and polymerase domains
MCKLALIGCHSLIKQQFPDVCIIGQIHDEVLFELPGRLTLNLNKSKVEKGVIIKPYWEIPLETLEIANKLRDKMIEVGTNYLDNILTCEVGEPTIAPYWSK